MPPGPACDWSWVRCCAEGRPAAGADTAGGPCGSIEATDSTVQLAPFFHLAWPHVITGRSCEGRIYRESRVAAYSGLPVRRREGTCAGTDPCSTPLPGVP